MTVAVESQGKRSVNAELNLVPFIDFLSVLISFLLVSAVWTQLSRLSVSTGQSEVGGPGPVTPPPALQLTITVTKDNLVLGVGPIEKVPFPKSGTQYNFSGLYDKLSNLKTEHPEQESIRLEASAGVPYEEIVRTIDVCIKAGFPGVDVGPSR